MRTLDWILLVIAAAAVLGGIAAVTYSRRARRKTLDTLNAMLDDAIRDDFHTSRYDESLLSAVEMRLSHYLSASVTSERNLRAEKEKIKELIADISHQTRTPLSNILLYAQLLREENLPGKAGGCVEALNAQAEKLSFLISALVKTSRLESGVLALHPHMALIQPVLEQVRSQIALRAEEKRLTLDFQETAERAWCDPKWTAEALYNLCDNAVKYTPTGGSVTVCVQAYDLFCRIDVTDTGIGIAEDELPKIFGRFYRSETVRDAEGVGIGLYLSREIVSSEGGYIKVSSRRGEGTTFSVFLKREG